MRILIINGSPHKENTWCLTEKVKEQIAVLDNKVEFKEIHLSELNIPFCIGCSMCFRKGEPVKKSL
jgi:multimeric flavodoxin WrbA